MCGQNTGPRHSAGCGAVEVYHTDPAGNVSLPSTQPLTFTYVTRHLLVLMILWLDNLDTNFGWDNITYDPTLDMDHLGWRVTPCSTVSSTTGDAGTHGASGPNTPPQPTDKTGIAVSGRGVANGYRFLCQRILSGPAGPPSTTSPEPPPY